MRVRPGRFLAMSTSMPQWLKALIHLGSALSVTSRAWADLLASRSGQQKLNGRAS